MTRSSREMKRELFVAVVDAPGLKALCYLAIYVQKPEGFCSLQSQTRVFSGRFFDSFRLLKITVLTAGR
jgi:hypothetical protein